MLCTQSFILLNTQDFSKYKTVHMLERHQTPEQCPLGENRHAKGEERMLLTALTSQTPANPNRSSTFLI